VTLANRIVREVAGRDVAAALSTWERRRDRYWHRASSGLMSLLLAQYLGWPLWQQLAATALGVTFGGGLLSPDVDQARAWRLVDTWTPDWIIGSPLRHHGIAHAISLHVTLAAAGWHFGAPWFVWWVPLVWGMHAIGDALIGKGWHGEPGPPWLLWWGNRGLGWFKSGGVVGVLGTVACWVGMIWLLVPTGR
jgi:hypothetical protein